MRGPPLPRVAAALAIVLATGCGAAAAPRAPAITRHGDLVSVSTPSSSVDPRTVQFGQPPSCACAGRRTLGFNVLLPRGYDGKRRYPVLYLLHGAGDARDSLLTHPTRRNGQLGGDLRRLARGYPAIVVLLEGGSFGWYTNWWNHGSLGSPAWERYHLDEVIPLVERHFRVRPGRRWHAIAGWSMGGYGALFYASQRPDYFGSAASLSGRIAIRLPSFLRTLPANDLRRTNIWGDPRAQAFYWEGHDPTELVDNLRATRLYVHVGDGIGRGAAAGSFEAREERGLYHEAVAFTAAARRARVPVSLQVVRGLHNGYNERAGLAEALRRLTFSRIPRTPSSWTYRTVAREGRAWGIRFAFAAQPTRVITFRRIGDRLALDGSGTVTLTPPGRAPVTAHLPASVSLTG